MPRKSKKSRRSKTRRSKTRKTKKLLGGAAPQLDPAVMRNYFITQQDVNDLYDGQNDIHEFGKFFMDAMVAEGIVGEMFVQFVGNYLNLDGDDTKQIVLSIPEMLYMRAMDKIEYLEEQLQESSTNLKRCERRLALFQAEAMHDTIGAFGAKTGTTDAIPRRHLRQYFA